MPSKTSLQMDYKPIDAQYPTCELCGCVMRKPCTIAWEKPNGEQKGFMVCSRCYGVWICLQSMVEEGLISKTSKGGALE